MPTSDIDRQFLRATKRPQEAGVSGESIGIVDVFAGCGGLTIGAIEGARRSGRKAHVELAVDVWEPALEVLGLSVGVDEDGLLRLDLKDTLGRFADRVRETERPIIDGGRDARLLLAGPPCQGYSALNNRTRYDDERNDRYIGVARVARLLDCEAVIIENVLGVGRDRRRAVHQCTAALEELGYEVVCASLDLHHLGAAQTRTRHVLVATKGWELDLGFLREVPGRDVEWAIGDLDHIDGRTLMDTASIPTAENQRRMDWLVTHDERYDLPNRLRPKCHRGDHSYKSMYGQLQWDRPAQTITSGFGSMGQGRFVHPSAARTLTPHEAARLQFLPDFMDFGLVDHRQWLATMIGNAAPPVLTIAIVEALIEQGLLGLGCSVPAEAAAGARIVSSGAPAG